MVDTLKQRKLGRSRASRRRSWRHAVPANTRPLVLLDGVDLEDTTPVSSTPDPAGAVLALRHWCPLHPPAPRFRDPLIRCRRMGRLDRRVSRGRTESLRTPACPEFAPEPEWDRLRPGRQTRRTGRCRRARSWPRRGRRRNGVSPDSKSTTPCR